jgi:archaellum component FlaC
MAQYTVQAPDGQTITLEGPDGASQADVIAQAQKLYQPKGSVEVSAAPAQFGQTGGGAAVGRPQGIDRTNVLPEPRPLESALAGATKSIIDPAVAAAQVVTGGNLGTSEYAKKLGEQADVYQQENPVWYGTGRVAGAVAPAMAMTKGIGVIPSFAKLSPYAQAAGIGATQGILTPEETGKKDLELLKQQMFNAGTGAAIGAPMPLVGKVANTVYGAGKAALEPFNQAGRNLIIGRALRQFSGNDAEKAIANLRNPEQLVAGVQPTVAEVAGVPSLAAVQRAVGGNPITTNAFAARKEANDIARTEALRNIASPTRVAKYQDLRSQLGDELYTPALNTAMDFSTLTPEMQKQVSSLAKTPAIKRAMSQAQENALNKGYDIGNPNGSLQGLHETKMALDQEINAVKAKLERDGAGATSAELDGLKAAKDRLLGFIETVSPEYKQARQTYARLSKPVEQLESISKLAEKSLNPKDYSVYLGNFSRELEKVKKEGLLSTQQLKRLENIKEDLMRTDFANNAGRGVGSNTMQNLAYNNMLQEVNLPNLLRRRGMAETVGNIAARVKDVAYGGANKRLTTEMADALLDPRKAAALMKLAGKRPLEAQVPTEQSNLAKLLLTQGGINAVNAIRGQSNE